MSKGETLASDIANSNFVRNSNSLSLYSSSCQQNNKKFIFLCQTKQFFYYFFIFYVQICLCNGDRTYGFVFHNVNLLILANKQF